MTAGDVLFELTSPELDFEGDRAARRARTLEALIAREAAAQENAERVSVLRVELEATLLRRRLG